MLSRVLQRLGSKKRDTVRSSEVRTDIVHTLLTGNLCLIFGLNESESQVGIRMWICSYITLWLGYLQREPEEEKKTPKEPFDDILY